MTFLRRSGRRREEAQKGNRKTTSMPLPIRHRLKRLRWSSMWLAYKPIDICKEAQPELTEPEEVVLVAWREEKRVDLRVDLCTDIIGLPLPGDGPGHRRCAGANHGRRDKEQMVLPLKAPVHSTSEGDVVPKAEIPLHIGVTIAVFSIEIARGGRYPSIQLKFKPCVVKFFFPRAKGGRYGQEKQTQKTKVHCCWAEHRGAIFLSVLN